MAQLSTFELKVQSTTTDDEYRLVAEWSRAGGLPARRERVLEVDQAALEAEATAVGYGQALGRMVFVDGVRELFAQARSDGSELRIMLSVETKALQGLRWERLAGPFDDDQWQLLGQSQRTPFSMYLPSASDRRFLPFGRRDLRALVVVASPDPENRYGVEPFDEAAAIDTALEGLGEIPSRVLGKDPRAEGPPTLGEICKRLTAERYTLLHLVCHGAFSVRTGETAVFLDGDDGKTDAVKATDLIQRLRELGTDRGLPHLAFLGVCDSAKPEAETVLGGLGQRLVRDLGMPAVVAMTERVSQATAFALAKELYTRLRDHGMADRALAEACVEVRRRDDVVVPALFSRLAGRPLFTDHLDRPLTAIELAAAAEQLEALFEERAPALVERARSLAAAVAVDPDMLTGAAIREHRANLAEVEQLCEDVLELSFSALAHGRQPPPYEVQCPFPGLQAFTAEQRKYFRGRDVLVEALQKQLEERSFLAVLGSSGSGKSSLVMAGVIPRLQDISPGLRYAQFKPGDYPMDRLEEALTELGDAPDWVIYVDQFEEVFTLCRKEPLRKAFFERLLSLVTPKHRVVISMRADFIGDCASHKGLRERVEGLRLIPPMSADELRNAIEEQGSAAGLRYETGLCELILEDLEDEPGAMPLLQHALRGLYGRRHGRWLRVQSYNELGRVSKAITMTAEAVWDRLDETDQDRLISVMLDLTEVRETEGGEVRYLRRRVPLAHLYAARAATKAPWGTLSSHSEQPAITRLIDLLAAERLLVKSQDDYMGDVVEVAHEALLRSWDRLQEWLAAARDSIRLRQDMEAAASQWRENGLSRAYLEHIEERGDRVRSFLREGTFKLDPRLKEYFDACEAEEQRLVEEREQQQREKLEAAEKLAQSRLRRVQLLRRATVVVALVGVLAIVAAILSLFQYLEAEEARQDAQAKEQEANDAKILAEAAAKSAKLARQKTQQAYERQKGLMAELKADEPGKRAEGVAEAVSLARGKALDVEALPYEVQRALYAATRGLHAARELREHERGLPITDLAFSPDGQRLATASRDDTAKTWDVASGTVIETLAGHEGDVEHVEFVRPSGGRILTVGADGKLELWDGRKAEGFMGELEEKVVAACVSANGAQMTVAGKVGESGKVTMWTRRMDGGWDPTVMLEEAGELITLSCAGAGSRSLVVYGATAHVLEAGARAIERVDLVGDHAELQTAVLSPDGARVATGDADGVVTVWDTDTRAMLRTFEGEGAVEAIAFSPAGNQLAAALERAAVIWDVDRGEKLATLRGHRSTVSDLAYTPDGLRVATVSWDKTLRLWNAQTGAELAVLEGHGDRILHVAISPDGQRIATAANDGLVRVWNATSGTQKTLLPDRGEKIKSMVSAPDGSWVAMASSTETKIWDVATQSNRSADVDEPTALAGSADGTRILGVRSQAAPTLLDATGEFLADLTPTSVQSIALSSDAKQYATGGTDGTLILWNTESMQPTAKPVNAHGTRPVLALDISPDGKHLVTGGADKTVRVWSRDGLQKLQERKVNALVYAVAFSPDGTRIAIGDGNGGVRLWSWSPNEVKTLAGHLASVLTVAFSPDGQRLVTAGVDTSVVLWSADSGKELFSPGRHARPVIMARFVDDGAAVISGSKDGVVEKWIVDLQQRMQFACEALDGVAVAAEVADVCKELVRPGATGP